MARFSFNLANIDGNNGFIIDNLRGISSGSVLNILSSPRGDLNGDGLDDIPIQSSVFIGNTGVEQENFVIFGSNIFPPSLDIGSIDGNNGLLIENTITGSNSFSDVNGDNIDDLIVSSIQLSTQNLLNFVILGSPNLSSPLNPQSLNGGNGFTIIDSNGDLTSLPFQGDINNDSIQDLIFLSSNTTEGVTSTVNKVVFGRQNFTSQLDISNLNGSDGFIVGGRVVFNDGGVDVNGDNIDDLIFNDSDRPQTYVLFGSNNFISNVDVTALNGSNGWIIIDSNSDANTRLIGNAIDDFNGDGIGDIVIQQNVPNPNDPSQFQANRLSIVFGSNANPGTIDLANLNGDNGFSIFSPISIVPSDDFNVEFSGDFNGDSIQDLIVLDITGVYSVIFGNNQGFSPNLDLANLNGANGFTITNNDILVADVGDINGDNIDDLIIDKHTNNSYVLFGSQGTFAPRVDLTNGNSNALLISGAQANNGVASVADFNNDNFDDILFNTVVDDSATIDNASSAVLFGKEDFNIPPGPEGTIDLFRFRNTTFNTGTYIFVGAAERDAILNNPDFNQTFELEGSGNPAFRASTTEGEGLVPFFRLQSLVTPGTFLFVSTVEYNGIFAPDSDQRNNFQPEGLDELGNDIPEFYLFGIGANQGIEFNRFQNISNNTFLYAGPEETNAILADPNLSGAFTNQGAAFGALPIN